MAKTIIIQPNQSTLDLVLTACGTLETGVAIWATNGGVDSEVIPGMSYMIPDGVLTDDNVLKYLLQNNITIGTAGQS